MVRFSLRREFVIVKSATGCTGGYDRQCHVWAGGVDTGSTQLGYLELDIKKMYLTVGVFITLNTP